MRKQAIENELTTMADNFRNAAKANFAFTASDFRTFEKGRYCVIYSRPNKRTAQILGVAREILTIITNFPEQQARLIASAKHWMSQEQPGRLEPRHVIVIHTDTRGNSKLREWGREGELTVLPFLNTQLTTDGNDFERLLAEQLFQWDPFDITGPVADDSQFYGRREEALQLARRLQSGQILSLLGIRKVGKTSVINRTVNHCKNQFDCDIVMLDCSQDSIWSSNAAGILASLCDGIMSARASNDQYKAINNAPKGEDVVTPAANLVSIVLQTQKPLIIFIDEVDYITPGSPTSSKTWTSEFNPLWRNIRATYQEAARQGGRLSIVVSGVSSKWFSVERIDGTENAALAFVPETYLGPFAPTAANEMVKRLALLCGLKFDKEAAERVSSACGYMPFWIRKACSAIHRQVDLSVRPLTIRSEDVDRHLERFIAGEGAELARVALAHLFSAYPDVKDACEAASERPIPSSGSRNRAERAIEQYGLLVLVDGKYSMPKMVLAGLRALNAEKITESVRPPESELAKTALDEWAEDLAVVGVRRNKIEAKLRDILLGLIRADVLNGQSGNISTADRLSAAISTERRKGLPSEPDQIMAKMFWLELLTLAEKEWKLTAKLFGDLGSLKEHGKIINERPDAHAKKFDKADYALWRRALSWFEDRVNRV